MSSMSGRTLQGQIRNPRAALAGVPVPVRARKIPPIFTCYLESAQSDQCHVHKLSLFLDLLVQMCQTVWYFYSKIRDTIQ